MAPKPGRPYQTRQEFTGYMGWPLVQPKALPNSSSSALRHSRAIRRVSGDR